MPNCFKCNKELVASYYCNECIDALHAQIDRDLEEIDTKHPPSEVLMGFVYAWPEDT